MRSLSHIGRWPLALVLLILPCVCIELVLQGADHGLWGAPRWRALAYQFGAFWPGLLSGWRPNFGAQPWLMFLSYAFLHGGLMHLIVNMITMVSLGGAVINYVGQRRFLAIYVGATILGGAAFAFLAASGFRPMVGASGALFGLAGALIVWNSRLILRQRPGWMRATATIAWPLGILTVLNVLMYVGTGGAVAWETHLGGFLAGAVMALPMEPRETDHPRGG
ncbi:membrane associated rhomboid family serine protease [Roseovarius halotolerans]|uniref:Rhomboid protease GluP n=1 Tax=Roseovarius halotolerans TaxID=505353 RepID=A0A1X6Z1U5_9RHOB|nr:rhomboid family intramembrane serine protease [Roseovarius halotolerans]RKT32359.1 membrane associated rhomboid family serine protease [Roseovarius halotolerans]SLN38284.1 Rhomboid protease GluP [Roseovarius halotolerans]